MDRESRTILALLGLGCAVMGYVDGVLQPGYGAKSAIKLVYFLILPLIFYFRRSPAQLRRLFARAQVGIKPLLLGLGVYFGILLLYFTIGSLFDFSQVAGALEGELGVDRGNFLVVSLYIAFVNSLLEEFFFRGLGYLALREGLSRRWAGLVSALSFALYHVSMLGGWFRPDLLILLIFLLVLAGQVLNRLDEGSRTLWCSWCVHMFANFSINTVGFLLLGMV